MVQTGKEFLTQVNYAPKKECQHFCQLPCRRSPGGLYYLSYLDRDMLLGRAVGGGGVFVFTRAQPLTVH